jgi:heme/copper-type cytochrome/quinol oxidase subunit 2
MDALSTALAWGVLAAAVVVFLGVQIWLLVAAWRTPRSAPPASLPSAAPRYRLSRGWEVVWTLLPALALLALALLSLQALLAQPPARPPGTPALPATPRGLEPSLPWVGASLASSPAAAARSPFGSRSAVPRAARV